MQPPQAPSFSFGKAQRQFDFVRTGSDVGPGDYSSARSSARSPGAKMGTSTRSAQSKGEGVKCDRRCNQKLTSPPKCTIRQPGLAKVLLFRRYAPARVRTHLVR